LTAASNDLVATFTEPVAAELNDCIATDKLPAPAIELACGAAAGTLAGATGTLAGATGTLAGAEGTLAGAEGTLAGAEGTLAGAEGTLAGGRPGPLGFLKTLLVVEGVKRIIVFPLFVVVTRFLARGLFIEKFGVFGPLFLYVVLRNVRPATIYY
jgi:hypothetical protein